VAPDAGKVVIAGDPEGSSLIKSVRHAPGVEEPMPTKKPQLAGRRRSRRWCNG